MFAKKSHALPLSRAGVGGADQIGGDFDDISSVCPDMQEDRIDVLVDLRGLRRSVANTNQTARSITGNLTCEISEVTGLRHMLIAGGGINVGWARKRHGRGQHGVRSTKG